jgi:PKD repeat protein
LLKEKRFLLVAATGLFAVFTLSTAQPFSMIAFTRGGEGFIQQVVDSDNPYYFLRQASASEAGETTGEGEPSAEITDEPPEPTCPNGQQPDPATGECPRLPPPPEPDVQQVVPEEGGTTAPPTTAPPTIGGEPLTATFSIDSTNGDTAPATFLFEADAQGGTGPYTYIWNFGDGSPQGSGISIHHTFEQAGTYDVTLAVIDSTGQDISVTRQVNVRPTTTEQLPPTNQTTLTNETATAQVLSIELECVNGPDGTIYCPYVPPTTGTTPLPAGCISTTEGIFCPVSPNTTIANVTGTPTVNATIVVETSETDPGIVEYTCSSNPVDPNAPLDCECTGVQDCLDLERSGRCEDPVVVFEGLGMGFCTEKKST